MFRRLSLLVCLVVSGAFASQGPEVVYDDQQQDSQPEVVYEEQPPVQQAPEIIYVQAPPAYPPYSPYGPPPYPAYGAPGAYPPAPYGQPVAAAPAPYGQQPQAQQPSQGQGGPGNQGNQQGAGQSGPAAGPALPSTALVLSTLSSWTTQIAKLSPSKAAYATQLQQCTQSGAVLGMPLGVVLLTLRDNGSSDYPLVLQATLNFVQAALKEAPKNWTTLSKGQQAGLAALTAACGLMLPCFVGSPVESGFVTAYRVAFNLWSAIAPNSFQQTNGMWALAETSSLGDALPVFQALANKLNPIRAQRSGSSRLSSSTQVKVAKQLYSLVSTDAVSVSGASMPLFDTVMGQGGSNGAVNEANLLADAIAQLLLDAQGSKTLMPSQLAGSFGSSIPPTQAQQDFTQTLAVVTGSQNYMNLLGQIDSNEASNLQAEATTATAGVGTSVGTYDVAITTKLQSIAKLLAKTKSYVQALTALSQLVGAYNFSAVSGGKQAEAVSDSVVLAIDAAIEKAYQLLKIGPTQTGLHDAASYNQFISMMQKVLKGANSSKQFANRLQQLNANKAANLSSMLTNAQASQAKYAAAAGNAKKSKKSQAAANPVF